MGSRALWVVVLLLATACGGAAPRPVPPTPLQPEPPASVPPAPAHEPAVCGGANLRVAFYNAGQALAALVTLPRRETHSGRRRRVSDAARLRYAVQGVARARDGRLARDLGDAPIDLLWITHPHSDHIGGAVDVLNHFTVSAYVDNGRDLTKATIKATRKALAAHQVPVTVIEPGAATVPLATSEDVKLTALVPPQSTECGSNANVCSIALRIDYCASSILFTGDAEAIEEADLTVDAPVTLLQVGHHGSKTSSSPALLDRALPKYAVPGWRGDEPHLLPPAQRDRGRVDRGVGRARGWHNPLVPVIGELQRELERHAMGRRAG